MSNSATDRATMAAKIMAREVDPARWLLEAKRIAEGLKLNPARCIPLGVTLDSVCFEILEEARKQGRSKSDVMAAIG